MTEPKTPEPETIIELVTHTNVALIIAAITVGVIIGASIVFILPAFTSDDVTEEHTDG